MSKNKPSLFENARTRLQESLPEDALPAVRPTLIPGKGNGPSSQQAMPDQQNATLAFLDEQCAGNAISFSVHQREVQLAVAPYRKVSKRTLAVVKLFLDGEFFWVLLEDWPFPDKSGGQFDSKLFHALPRDLRNRLLMLQVGGIIHLLNRHTGIQVQVVSDEDPDRIQDASLLEIELSTITSKGDHARARLLCPTGLLPKLKQLIDGFWPDSAQFSELEKHNDVTIKLGSLVVTVGKLRSLEPGDFVYGSQDCLLGGAPVLCFDGQPVAYLKKIYENQFLVLEPGEAAPEKIALNGDKSPEFPDQLLIDLSLYLEQNALSREKVSALNPGELVDVAVPLDGTVMIMAGEQLLGKGEIVGVGLDAAIQITEIFGRH